MPKKPPPKRRINLALQGGGAHGALTWGVLEALALDGRLDIEGISATSAGAMNAATFLSGFEHGGTDGALQNMETFWRGVSELNAFAFPADLQPSPGLDKFFESLPLWQQGRNQTFSAFEQLSKIFSPYQLNPLNINPLRTLLKKHVQIGRLRRMTQTKLFVTATHIRTGTPRIFCNSELSVDALLASAALPFLFQAVKIGKEYYWDGGYMGNPSLWPLFYETGCRDILIVHLNPIQRHELPRDSYSIENRLNEITFNAALLKELRAIAFVKKLFEEDWLKPAYRKKLKNILIHAIRDDDLMDDLSISSKFETDWSFLNGLRAKGAALARAWLRRNFSAIGERSTVNIHRDYLTIGPDDRGRARG